MGLKAIEKLTYPTYAKKNDHFKSYEFINMERGWIPSDPENGTLFSMISAYQVE